jgi:uncharacterized protein
MNAEAFTLDVDGAEPVAALVVRPADARACYVFAHGAGAGMQHSFMAACAEELGRLKIASLRYQFPYMQRRSRRPDPPELCHATVRAAVAHAGTLRPALPLIAGGRSFGGRMTSQAQALAPLPGVLGLAFLGFPLHPAKKPSVARATHLFDVKVPMLFLQGTRDELASLDLLRRVTDELGSTATLELAEEADHSFHVPVRSGRKDAEVRDELLRKLAAWTDSLIRGAQKA